MRTSKTLEMFPPQLEPQQIQKCASVIVCCQFFFFSFRIFSGSSVQIGAAREGFKEDFKALVFDGLIVFPTCYLILERFMNYHIGDQAKIYSSVVTKHI